MHRALTTGLLAGVLAAAPLAAQDVPRPTTASADTAPLVAAPRREAARFLSPRSPVELALSRALAPGQRLALVIGSVDVSAG